MNHRNAGEDKKKDRKAPHRLRVPTQITSNRYPSLYCRFERKSKKLLTANYLASSNTATPGKVSPARNSRVAPPPVEMCEIFPSRPAWFTADTESPPPTIDVAPFCVASATAWAIATVPSSKGFSSNIPIGPFQ